MLDGLSSFSFSCFLNEYDNNKKNLSYNNNLSKVYIFVPQFSVLFKRTEKQQLLRLFFDSHRWRPLFPRRDQLAGRRGHSSPGCSGADHLAAPPESPGADGRR